MQKNNKVVLEPTLIASYEREFFCYEEKADRVERTKKLLETSATDLQVVTWITDTALIVCRLCHSSYDYEEGALILGYLYSLFMFSELGYKPDSELRARVSQSVREYRSQLEKEDYEFLISEGQQIFGAQDSTQWPLEALLEERSTIQ